MPRSEQAARPQPAASGQRVWVVLTAACAEGTHEVSVFVDAQSAAEAARAHMDALDGGNVQVFEVRVAGQQARAQGAQEQ
jgi:hypothetical protein